MRMASVANFEEILNLGLRTNDINETIIAKSTKKQNFIRILKLCHD